jgi:hypothetical protein
LAWTLVKVWLVTAPTEDPSTSTSDTWWQLAGEIVNP